MRYLTLLFALCVIGCATGREFQVPGDDEFEYYIEGDMAVPVPLGPQPFANTQARGPETIYLNFEGAAISVAGWSPQNAAQNQSFIPTSNSVVPAFAHGAWGPDRQQVIALVLQDMQELFAGLSVTFTLERPASGDYTMVMIGGHPEDLGRTGSIGIAPFDASNYNPSDVVFVFSARMAEFGYSLHRLADVTAHEVAHSVGLEHIDRTGDIMYPSACHCDMSWGAGLVFGETTQTQDDVERLNIAFPPDDAPLPQPESDSLVDGVLCGGSLVFSHPVQAGWTVPKMKAVGRLYCGVLDRTPDAAGFAAHVANQVAGQGLDEIAQAFVDSSEFISGHGALSDTEFVATLYQVALDREPDSSGMQSWLAALASGTPRGAVASSIVSSSEARSKLNPFFDF